MDLDRFDYINKEKHVPIEFGTELRIEIEGIPSRLRSVLVGMEPGEYLIIKTPSEAPGDEIFRSTSPLSPGTQVIVRYIHNGAVYGFQSRLLRFISRPARLLFIEYPKIIENCGLRFERRARCFFPAKIRIGEKDNHGVIVDISRKGCRCAIKISDGEELPPVDKDGEITLAYQLPGIEGEQVVSGKVKSILSDVQEMTLGIEFNEAAPEIQDRIDQYASSVEIF